MPGQENLLAKLVRLPRGVRTIDVRPRKTSQHPLLPLLDWAEAGRQRVLADVRDYTCVLSVRERLHGRLSPRRYMFAKVRHEQVKDGRVIVPLSIYLKFLAPESLEGREVLYVKGRDDDQLLVRKGGRYLSSLTTLIDPHGPMAMADHRYPITEMGILRLIERLVEVGRAELEHGECEVAVQHDFKTKHRVCTKVEVRHPHPRKHFQYHLARIYVDNDLQLPIRFESYLWPQAGDEEPPLLEEYTYHDLKINVGLTDEDFDCDCPDYQFGDVTTAASLADLKP